MKDVKNTFRRLQSKLMESRWFNDEWQIYNRGPYMQLYKANWYNDNQSGVHFETYIEAREIKLKRFPVCLHAEEDCPSQQTFIEKLIEMESSRIRSWKGVELVGEGYSVCEKSIPLNVKNLEDRLYTELNQLRQLEDSIDQILSTLRGET